MPPSFSWGSQKCTYFWGNAHFFAKHVTKLEKLHERGISIEKHADERKAFYWSSKRLLGSLLRGYFGMPEKHVDGEFVSSLGHAACATEMDSVKLFVLIVLSYVLWGSFDSQRLGAGWQDASLDFQFMPWKAEAHDAEPPTQPKAPRRRQSMNTCVKA
eukprot:2286277-Amphidinium_carterae.1